MKNSVTFEWKNDENFFIREAYNTLKTNVLFCGRGVKVIVVTSSLENEGKSTVSLGLAKGLAENGEQVLLIDADMRKSVFANKAKVEGTLVGLSQVLSEQIAAEDAIYESDCKGLDIIFAGPFPPNPTDLLNSNEFPELITALRDRYDHIIIDAPPLGIVVDASVIAGSCDGSILVINRGQIRFRMVQRVKNQLERSGCRILGAVFNQTGWRKRFLSSRHTYGYYGKYGAYRYSKYGTYVVDNADEKEQENADQAKTKGSDQKQKEKKK